MPHIYYFARLQLKNYYPPYTVALISFQSVRKSTDTTSVSHVCYVFRIANINIEDQNNSFLYHL